MKKKYSGGFAFLLMLVLALIAFSVSHWSENHARGDSPPALVSQAEASTVFAVSELKVAAEAAHYAEVEIYNADYTAPVAGRTDHEKSFQVIDVQATASYIDAREKFKPVNRIDLAETFSANRHDTKEGRLVARAPSLS